VVFVALAAVVLVAAAFGARINNASGSAKRTGVSGKISIIAKWSGDEQKSFEAVLAPFKQKNPGIKINYTPGGDNTPQLVSTALAGGNPPDIATVPQPGTMKDFANRNALKPLTFAKGVVAANYASSWIATGSTKGKFYGLAFKASNKSTVWYNVKAFRNAGVKQPTTWPAFLKAAKTVKASGSKAYSLGASDGWTLTDLFENIYLRQAGPTKYDQLTAHKIKWTDPSVIKALKTMGQIVGDTGNIAGGKSGALQTDFNTSVSNVLSKSPKAAMVIEGDFVPGVVASATNVKAFTDYNEFPFPTIGSSGSPVLAGADIVVMLKDSPAARALIKYLATAQAQTIWAKRGGYTSPNKNVPASAYSDPLNRKTAIALSHAKVSRFDMSDQQPAAFGATAGQGEWKLFQDFVSNPSNASGIARKLEAAAAKAYK
jgi:ABC-type glycerol-3-phosphate transport system substrate-binding protein